MLLIKLLLRSILTTVKKPNKQNTTIANALRLWAKIQLLTAYGNDLF